MNKLMKEMCNVLNAFVVNSLHTKDVTVETLNVVMGKAFDVEVILNFVMSKHDEYEVTANISTDYNVSFKFRATTLGCAFEPVSSIDLVTGETWTYGFEFSNDDINCIYRDAEEYYNGFTYMMSNVINDTDAELDYALKEVDICPDCNSIMEPAEWCNDENQWEPPYCLECSPCAPERKTLEEVTGCDWVDEDGYPMYNDDNLPF